VAKPAPYPLSVAISAFSEPRGLIGAPMQRAKCCPDLPGWRRKYVHLMMQRGRKIAKVAMARRLAVALYWMWRNEWNYEQSKSLVRRVENSPLIL
jgi:hypothetical protein